MNDQPELSLDELAFAYELKQAGCCWKRIALGLGCDHVLLQNKVTHLMRNGIGKGLDGYARSPGRPARFDMRIIRHAEALRRLGVLWARIGDKLGVDHWALRTSHRYAKKKGLI